MGTNSKSEKSGSYYVNASISCSLLELYVKGTVTKSNSAGSNTGVIDNGFNVTIPYSYQYYDPQNPQTIYNYGGGVTNFGCAEKTEPVKKGYFYSKGYGTYLFDLPENVTINLTA